MKMNIENSHPLHPASYLEEKSSNREPERNNFRKIVEIMASNIHPKPTKDQINSAASFLESSSKMGATSPSVGHAGFIEERTREILNTPSAPTALKKHSVTKKPTRAA